MLNVRRSQYYFIALNLLLCWYRFQITSLFSFVTQFFAVRATSQSCRNGLFEMYAISRPKIFERATSTLSKRSVKQSKQTQKKIQNSTCLPQH
jgi:hypothetical protein